MGTLNMDDYVFGGASDIDRAIGYLIALDNSQSNALAVLQIDDIITELTTEYEKAVADPAYRTDDDFISRLAGYLEMADVRENPDLR
ncbi:hypothetical protein JF66_06685 [Cryobacterium sp. MLB-32]|uniref:hypothetical protein n=1 Tax=Cryobacterium sp. MLB-32 TaxID=1529318 RepID=UPI0004E658DA|nr:hypothetical protein [Cryobacterium sp. MLB-32]KFF60124.1 hypothetical protein JF66_06685 [Cryobacterium sp. MLB-32]